MAVMFAAMTFYAPVFPLSAALCLGHTLFEASSDAYKLCEVQRRLLPRRSDEVALEAWLEIFRAISFGGVACSVALVAVADPDQWSMRSLVLVEHAMVFFKGYLSWSIPDIPEWIRAEEIKLNKKDRMSPFDDSGAPQSLALQVRPMRAVGLKP